MTRQALPNNIELARRLTQLNVSRTCPISRNMSKNWDTAPNRLSEVGVLIVDQFTVDDFVFLLASQLPQLRNIF